jgi:hypothetical protein
VLVEEPDGGAALGVAGDVVERVELVGTVVDGTTVGADCPNTAGGGEAIARKGARAFFLGDADPVARLVVGESG